MRDLRKLKGLSTREWRYLSWAIVMLPLIRGSLAIWSFNSVLTALGKTSPLPGSLVVQPASPMPAPTEIRRVVRMVNAAANRGPVKANCLPRSLTIWWLLRRQGLDCELRLGVKPRDAAIQAHAWVEHRGEVLNDDPGIAARFSAFESVSLRQGRQGT